MTDVFNDEVYGDADPNNLPEDNRTAVQHSAGSVDGLPGVPVHRHPGLRAGAFGIGQGALGIWRADSLGGDDAGVSDATAYPAAAGAQGPNDPSWTHSPLTFCPVPGYTHLNSADPSRRQGGGWFGARRTDSSQGHAGDDFTTPVGSSVVAPGDGTVQSITPIPGYGNRVVIDHGGGLYTEASHLSRVDVQPGQQVVGSQQIGLSGRSGNVPALADSHVHFEVRQGSPLPRKNGGNPVNPANYLPPWCFQ